MKKNKRTFEEFLQIIYAMNFEQFEQLNEKQKKAAEVDYINRYGSPIKWF